MRNARVSGWTSSERRRSALIAGVLALTFGAEAGAVDWSSARAVDIPLFYPGQMSWEKTLTADAHKGAPKIRAGEACVGCHADETADMGASRAESTGFAGRSSMTIQVRAAVEAGQIHWQIRGPVAAGGAPAVAIMLGSDAIKTTAQAGCWGACHDDAPGMASDSGLALGKYLSRSRSKNTATGGGTSVRPGPELDAALAAGEFFDLIEVDASGAVERGYVLDKLHVQPVAGAGSMRVEGDQWIAEVQRPLAAVAPGEMALSAGGVFHFGVAVHDPGVGKHEHLVSLAHTVAIGSGSADLLAAGSP